MSDHVLRRLRAVLVAGAAAVAMAATPAAPALAAPAATTAGYAGQAYGTSVSVGSTVTAGPTSLIGFGCGTPAGYHTQNSVASATLGFLSTGTVVTTGDTGVSPTRTVTSARVQDVSLLGGLVSATAIRSVSTVTAGSSGYQTSPAGTTFGSLKVAGLALPLNPQPNTTIALLGVGRIVLNEQVRTVSSTSATFTVNGLHIVVDPINLLGLAAGTDIVVAQASSSLSPPQSGALTGLAYGSQATVSPLLASGPSFPQSLPCTGTNGVVTRNTGVGISVPSVLTLGTITNTARGSITPTTTTGQTTSTIQSVSLLNGLVTATGIKAVATATRTGGRTTVSDAGSTFASITVNGRKIDATVARNTAIRIAGIGTLHLRRTLTTGNQIEVRMIELDITAGNVAGVPIGTTVYIGVARAGAF